jgi:hypothetical protein
MPEGGYQYLCQIPRNKSVEDSDAANVWHRCRCQGPGDLQQRCTVSHLNTESSHSGNPTSGARVFEETPFSNTQIRFIERLSKYGPNVRRFSHKPLPHT